MSRSRGGVPRLLAGPLKGVIPELVRWLRVQGYATGTVMSVAETAARLSAWMHMSVLTVEDVSDELQERFVTAQVTGPVRHPSSAHHIVTVRKYLVACGMLGETAAAPAQPPTPVTVELDAWGGWLTERGIRACGSSMPGAPSTTGPSGLQPRGRATPRLHSFRHSFTTAHIAAAYRSRTDAQRTLTLLSTWLGHTSPAHTYWYVSATPELMALAAGRLAMRPVDLAPGEGTPR